MVFTSVFTEGGQHPKVKAAFLLLAPSGSGQTVPIAGVILDGVDASCSTLHPADGKGAKQPLSQRINPDKNNFPVTVCEAIYSASGAMQVKGSEAEIRYGGMRAGV